MIRLIEARNFRSLRSLSQPLDRFHVQVGPNASGKTTFQDVIRFLGLLVGSGLEAAIEEFSSNRDVRELFWNHQGRSFQLAAEWEIPSKLIRPVARDRGWDRVRYEVEIGLDEQSRPAILQERGLLKGARVTQQVQPDLFPRETGDTGSLITAGQRGIRKIFGKSQAGNDVFNSEVEKEGGKGWALSLRLGPNNSALRGVPEDSGKFPISIWLRQTLREGIQRIVLDSQEMRRMSPPTPSSGESVHFKPDGSNLPWVVDEFKDSPNFRKWVAHVQTALPDIETIQVGLREDIRHKYLKVVYRNGPTVPAWLLSDGTLRLLALTLPAYLPSLDGVFLFEEPENGIHPRAMETVINSLRSMYKAQVLVATHSPVVISVCSPSEILCFAKKDGATDVIRGDQHPSLARWRGSPDLSVLFASGVLG